MKRVYLREGGVVRVDLNVGQSEGRSSWACE